VTKHELLKKIYQLQVRNSKKRGHMKPKYSFGSFRDLAIKDSSFTRIYNEWVDSGYDKELTPSCDRILDNHGYSFENIQWLTYRDNLSKPKGLQQIRIALLNRANSPVAVFFGLNNASKILSISTQKLTELLNSGEIYRDYKYVILKDWK